MLAGLAGCRPPAKSQAPAAAASLARHTQTVLQGAFVLSKAANDPALVLEAIGHLRRYLECVLDGTSPDANRRPISGQRDV